jgi:hypothetical protein
MQRCYGGAARNIMSPRTDVRVQRHFVLLKAREIAQLQPQQRDRSDYVKQF